MCIGKRAHHRKTKEKTKSRIYIYNFIMSKYNNTTFTSNIRSDKTLEICKPSVSNTFFKPNFSILEINFQIYSGKDLVCCTCITSWEIGLSLVFFKKWEWENAINTVKKWRKMFTWVIFLNNVFRLVVCSNIFSLLLQWQMSRWS